MKSLERSVQLLEFMVNTPQVDWSISELVRDTGHSLSTLHRILASWQSLGFVQQDPRTRRYRLGLKLMTLGMALWRHMDIRSVARPVMELLSREVNMSVYLTVRDQLDGVIADVVEGPSPLRVVPSIGLRLPLHVGASRKVLIAYLPEEEREEIIRQLPWTQVAPATVTDENKFRADLDRIREVGYEISFGQTMAGSAGVAVPVWGAEGRVVSGLMAAGPEAEFRGDCALVAAEATVRAGQVISRLLGYKRQP
jgi:IclR family KDG regulon transcriptional repressor